ncbi:MAG: hypothetical protein FJ087_17415 [Deltaproteobacteria bacterium]|nr:hypothetical protein [Deltaproteobacteria bacterium]
MPNFEHPDLALMTGACTDQPSAAAGYACAERDARKRLAAQVGVPPAAVTGGHVRERWSERRAGAGEVVDAYVLVAFPRSEVARVEARAARRVRIEVACAGEPEGACAGVRSRVEALASAAGLAIAAAGARPAAVVSVKASVAPGSEDAGAHFAHAEVVLRVTDAADGNVMASFETGRVKGGHFSPADAAKAALDAAVAKLAAPLSEVLR